LEIYLYFIVKLWVWWKIGELSDMKKRVSTCFHIIQILFTKLYTMLHSYDIACQLLYTYTYMPNVIYTSTYMSLGWILHTYTRCKYVPYYADMYITL
jgi:hypothetical protein